MKRALPPAERYDLIVPVPLHVSGMRQRSYNQAGLLARELGRMLACPVNQRLLRKQHQTLPQHNLSATDRERNILRAFMCKEVLSGEHVLLVDDVFTTGATVAACTKTLLAAGAQKVTVVTVARAG